MWPDPRHATVLATALALCLVPLAAKAQTAEDLIQQFETYCIKTQGDRDTALRALEADGWMVAPQVLIDQLGPDYGDAEIRISSGRSAFYVAILAEIPLDQMTPACMMGMAPGVSDLATPLRTWSDGPPLVSENGDVGFLFRESEGALQVVTTKEEAERLSRDEALLMVSGRNTPELTMMVAFRQRNIVW